MQARDPKRFWEELLRRRVVRSALYYTAGAWVLAQAMDLLLDAFDASHYMRFVIAGLVLGLPIVTVLAWMFDVTPRGIERTHDVVAFDGAATPAAPALAADDVAPPAHSIAVMPFTNLSQEAGNEYFAEGLSEEIRNQLAREKELRVAARSSSVVFKGRTVDAREIGRRLNVAAILEGGVRKQADTVRIDVQLVNASDGFQLWSETFERQLGDIFQLQSEVACAVLTAVRPKGALALAPPRTTPATGSFEAYNLYLLGRHHFHKRTATALQRAVDCFEQAIARDPDYALAYSGLSDAYMLSSAGYYGDMSAALALARATPATMRALELAPELAEAHTSLGLIRHSERDYATAEQAFLRALELNPAYTTAHVWYGLVLTAQGRYEEAAARNLEAFRLDPLSPIINTNAAFDALRAGDEAAAIARFNTVMEIDPAFPVPYSGMARLHALKGELRTALRWIDQAIERASSRSFYLSRKGLFLLQLGETGPAFAAIDAACGSSPDNAFDADLVVAMRVLQADRAVLARIAEGRSTRKYAAEQRAQAHIALGNRAAARALYDANPPDPRTEIRDVLNDEWIWRLPHIVNYAHLRIEAGEAAAGRDLENLLAQLRQVWEHGGVNVDTLYWAASAEAVLGRREPALQYLEDAVQRGWRQAWWARLDWNLEALTGDTRFTALLTRGSTSVDS